MKFGVLADLFEGAGAKVLTEVEVNRQRSNQHEFQGVSGFRAFLGTPAEKQTFPATFYWLEDDEDAEPIRLESFCTWSDVRRGRAGRSPEYHLYYAAESEPVVHRARAGDQVVIAKARDGGLMVLVSPEDSTIGQQLLWLFGLDLFEVRPVARRLERDDTMELGLAARSVLSDLGIEVEEPEPDAFAQLIDRFGRQFPGTLQLSSFARETLAGVDPKADPDGALIAWMEHEEALFRHLEREIVSDRLEAGFMEARSADVDGFLSFSLSVQNRRKSRAGYAFGHHVEAILQAHGVSYTREATTEKRNAADFLFPGEDDYADRRYPDDQLAMLAVKTSCKDRWRQVLAEADRIRTKHLLTLEPAISRIQTAEMRGQGLQLVLPTSLHSTYQADQRAWLMGVGEFLGVVRELRGRQRLLI
ncbi:type II restriction endonuclease [Ovoidimarina sediminis]|uniref:type II restriction endonuclease n=1 Tax=Ovoidimarina sediminis TaxID=3079856 RepID=UPI0029159ED5|nr:type II restriction endonuclease [Rhodophyticola sp. MJ-SS7]MDU8945994.1 type II restriction endonuclease [Rhodophyticola sp. MJ-SS7]